MKSAPRLRELVGPVDHAVETTGVSRVIDQAIKSLGPCGKMSMLGVSHEESHQQVTPQRPAQTKGSFTALRRQRPAKIHSLYDQVLQGRQFPFDKLIKQYPAPEINRAVKDSQDGHTVKSCPALLNSPFQLSPHRDFGSQSTAAARIFSRVYIVYS